MRASTHPLSVTCFRDGTPFGWSGVGAASRGNNQKGRGPRHGRCAPCPRRDLSMTVSTVTAEERRMGLALLAIRLAAGAVFIFHGSQKLFGAFNGPGLASFAHHMGLPVPVALLVGLAEFAGGLAVLTGVLARLG